MIIGLKEDKDSTIFMINSPQLINEYKNNLLSNKNQKPLSTSFSKINKIYK